MEAALTLYLFFAAISATFCGFVAADKGRTLPAWIVAGLLFPFVTLLALIAVTNRKERDGHERRHQELLAALAKREG